MENQKTVIWLIDSNEENLTKFKSVISDAVKDAAIFTASSVPVEIGGISADLINSLKLENEKLRCDVSTLLAAQKLVQIGSFEYDIAKKSLTLSDQAHRIFGISKDTSITVSTDIVQRIL